MNHWRQLRKGDEVFTFECRDGHELEALGAFAELAERPDVAFDWLDAAVLGILGKLRADAPASTSRLTTDD